MRTYYFDLPYSIGSFMLSMGWSSIHDDPLFGQLPSRLKHKILEAHDAGVDLVLTREDVDSIPDGPWAHIAGKLGLSYA
jgi:hypothetical protein